MRTIKTCNINLIRHFRIVNILLLFMGSLSLHAEQSVLGEKIDCEKITQSNSIMVKEHAISILTHSNIFKTFVKQYPADTKFSFPLEMISIHDGKKCFMEISAYVDETDHYSLVGSFVVKDGNRVMISKINE
ncbi:hypothetical protein [Sulfuricurvum sp.]|uniref:hypothetical protein n=1 Tax=Sulfuricurvum sp. TaxID=2025608 RepID=UPI0026104B08|nr:hypothetical protein [Sulfuricurvum sp.]MDD2267764.1 hypothetical protein [Sulfuricurvum sp.]MDD2783802.1 hypothetical protein [Sulfuricurvum sp.]